MLRKYYKLLLYENLNPKVSYIVGVDVAGGLSRDDSSICVIHPDTLKVVAIFRNNNVDTVNLTDIILHLVSTFIPKAVVVVERNSYGKNSLPIFI